MRASQARSRILGLKHCNCQRDDLFFAQSGLHTGSIFGQVRNTTVQVWTIGEGFGIGSEFSQTFCAANTFRDHNLDSIKATLVHRAHRLLSESARIVCTLRLQVPQQRAPDHQESTIARGERINNVVKAAKP